MLILPRPPPIPPLQCLHRWTKVLNPNLTKGPWTDDEGASV